MGEALDALVDTALISRIITLIGDVGNAALTVYDIVDDPKSVPLAIFGLLLGGVASRSEKSFSDAARIRRGMSDKMIAALGTGVSTAMGKISKLVKRCSI